MNSITDEGESAIANLMARTPPEFSITLSGNLISLETVERIQAALCTEENPELGKARVIF